MMNSAGHRSVEFRTTEPQFADHRTPEPTLFQISEQLVGHRQTVLIRPTERLDVMSALLFRQEIAHFLANGTTHFIIDLSATPGMDGAGMAALVSLFTRVRRVGGTVKLVSANAPAIQRMLRLTQLEHFFDVVEQ